MNTFKKTGKQNKPAVPLKSVRATDVKVKAQQPTQQTKKNLFIFLSGLAVLISLIYSYNLRWLGDDIFIGFRYIQNFVAGHGLVYNIGERVEGYTDFLWLVLVSFFKLLNFDETIVVQVLGVASSVGTLIIFSVIGYKMTVRYNAFIIPYIALALALNYDFAVWATSGLETSFFSFLLSAAFYTFFFSRISDNKRLMLTGFYLCMALLSRPDTLLILLCANMLFALYYFINPIKFVKMIQTLFFFNLAILVIYVPYFLWRYNYYGFIFPNTYYDKNGDLIFFSQGFYYIWMYFKPHFLSFLIILLPPFIIYPLLKKKPVANLREFLSDKWNAAFAACVSILYLYLIGFVAKVGGDFMHARFIIPIAPFIYFVIFYSVVKLVKKSRLNIVLSVLVFTSFIETNIRTQLFEGLTDAEGKWTILDRGIADERYVYTKYMNVKQDEQIGKAIAKVFKGLEAKMIVKGAQARLGYYTDLFYLQEFHGLTDTAIAHMPSTTRSHVGHEKQGTMEYFQNKGIHFTCNRGPLTKDTFRYAIMNIPPFAIRTEFITYNIPLMNQLKERMGKDFQFTDFTAYLDDYIFNKMPSLPPEKIKEDYDNFYLYYFKHNDDKARESKFIDALKSNVVSSP